MTKRLLGRESIWALALLFVLMGSIFAQDYRGKIQGTITDPTQAAVTSATVTLKNVNTGIETVKETDATGHYLFDFVQPGAYSVTVTASGFQKYVQENVTLLTRGDVTVNAALSVGAVTSAVEVTAGVTAVEFNTSTMTTTIQSNMIADMPVLARNPFTLALLNPAVVNKYWDVAHRNPFYMWSNGGMDIGGPTGGKNDQELDGTTLNISARGSYNLPMDSTQEVAVQQNAMDAEFGFSAGGTVNLSSKSGTNDIHGTAYFFGRNPKLDAVTDRTSQSTSILRSNIWGVSGGNPIIKNKLFNFVNFEQWKVKQPASKTWTLPTTAQRTGDFSSTLTPGGTQATIYDPLTTVFNGNTASRTPFAGNIIPKSRIDATGAQILADLPSPNNAGSGPTGQNNLHIAYPWWENYWNINDRVDYNISDKWRFFARFSKFQTRLDNPNWGGTIAVPSDNGGIMDAMNASADVLYMWSPKTTIDVRLGVTYMEDDYASQWAQVPTSEWAKLWGNNTWYNGVLNPAQGIYYPRFNFDANGTGNTVAQTGVGSWWVVHGRSYNPTVTVSHDAGIHHMKMGWQLRYSYDQDNASSGPGQFYFDSIDTGNTFQSSYTPWQSGNMYASALLGVVNSGNANIAPNLDMHQQQWGFYFQDDVKLNRNITLNLGLRWERETGPAEETRQLVKTLDLTNPIPELQNIKMPSAVTAVANVAYKFNGAMIYTSNSNPRMYDAPWNTFLPRVGIAYRLNDKTSIRVGYARYAIPWVTVHAETGGLPTYGYSQSTSAIAPLQGVPQTYISNPFPSSTNPVVLPTGNGLGRYSQLGNSVNYWNGNIMKTPINDRMNFNIQRQMMEHLFTEATFFVHLAHNTQDNSMWGGSYGYNVNQMDPNLAYQYKGAVDNTVANPFYNLPANIMPGSLRTQQNVTVSQLLRPYPQYTDLMVLGSPGVSDHYYGLALKAERPMTKGLTAMVGYNYNQEFHTGWSNCYTGGCSGPWVNSTDFYNNKQEWYTRNSPRHNMTIAGTWELPVGRGRTYLGDMNKILDYAIGGWATSQSFVFHSGDLLNFNSATVSGDPTQNVPSGAYFNPAVFSALPAYTARTNPWYYDGLRGPKFWQLDSTIVKYFKITERVKLELRVEMFNSPNALVLNDPDMTVGSGTMGRSTGLAGGNYGREIQYTGRIHF